MSNPADEPEDPILEARIDHAVAPYVGRLTPEAILEARRFLRVTLTTHPVLAPLMDQVRAEAASGASGVVPTTEEAEELPDASGKRSG
jgi:hypothetical protein